MRTMRGLREIALERGATSPNKEACHRVWRDFLAPLFGLNLIWMQSPAVSYKASPAAASASIVSNDNESVNEDDDSSIEENEMVGDMMVIEEVMKDRTENHTNDDSSDFCLLEQQPIPSGVRVSTVYGEGTIIKYHRLNNNYEIELEFGGIGYLQPKAVICTVTPVTKSSLTCELTSSDDEQLDRDDDMLCLGSQSLYLFFRLHQVHIRRLNIARSLAYSAQDDQSLSTVVKKMSSNGGSNVRQKRYEAFLSLVYNLVEGGYSSSAQGSSATEGGKYEDRVRCLLGHQAYELATLDKLVSHILKNLQNMANDETLMSMIEIFRRQKEQGTFNNNNNNSKLYIQDIAIAAFTC